MNKRGWTLAAFLLVLPVAAAPAAARTLSVWAFGNEGKKLRELAVRFEEENPGAQVEVQAIPWSSAHEKLITSVVGRTLPDVCQLGTTWMAEFGALGALLPLDEIIAEDSIVNAGDYFPASWETACLDGDVYGIPWYVDVRVLFYRKDLLEEAGYESPPGTWEEMMEVSRTLAGKTSQGADRYGISLSMRDWMMLSCFIWQNGGDVLSPDRSHSTLGSPEAIAAWEHYTQFFREGLAPTDMAANMDVHHAFSTGLYPMFFSGPWTVDGLRDRVPELNGKWDVAPLPKGRTRASFVGGCNLVIFRQSREKRLAWDFIRFLSRPGIQAEWYGIARNLPAVKQAWEDPRLHDEPVLQAFREQLEDVQAPPAILPWEQIAAIIEDQMEQGILEDVPISALARSASEKIDALLVRSRATKGNLAEVIPFLAWGFTLLIALLVGALVWTARQGRESRRLTLYPRAVPYGFLAPALIILCVFLVVPILASFLMSLTDWDIFALADPQRASFIGIGNYKRLGGDSLFWKTLFNTLYFVGVGAPATIALSLLAAVLLDRGIGRFRNVFRTSFFTPVVTTIVAVAVVWRWLYDPRYGILNWAIGFLGFAPRNWLGETALAMPSLIAMAVWKNFGYNMVIFLAGLQTIPGMYYEASSIDGAGRLRQFLHITLPLLAPTTVLVCIITTIGYLQFFAEPYVMTKGGPLNSTLSVVMLLYQQGFKYFNLGYASAIAYALFFIIAMFSLVEYKVAAGGRTS